MERGRKITERPNKRKRIKGRTNVGGLSVTKMFKEERELKKSTK